MTAEISNQSAFLWGALGAIVSFLVVFVLPIAVQIAKGTKVAAITPARLIAALVVVVIFIAAGGLLTIAFANAKQTKDALMFGLGMESILGGSLKGFGS